MDDHFWLAYKWGYPLHAWLLLVLSGPSNHQLGSLSAAHQNHCYTVPERWHIKQRRPKDSDIFHSFEPGWCSLKLADNHVLACQVPACSVLCHVNPWPTYLPLQDLRLRQHSESHRYRDYWLLLLVLHTSPLSLCVQEPSASEWSWKHGNREEVQQNESATDDIDGNRIDVLQLGRSHSGCR